MEGKGAAAWEAEGVEGSVEEQRRKGVREEDAGGGVMEEDSACSLCGRAFETGTGEEGVSAGAAEGGGDVRGGDVVEEAWRESCPQCRLGQC